VKKKKLNASMTVEAAFIVPIVLFIIFALMYLAFNLHDRVRMETVLEKALGKGDYVVAQRSDTDGGAIDYDSLNEKNNWGYFRSGNKQQEEEIRKYIEEELEKGFFILEKEKILCETDGFAVKIEIMMRQKVTLNPVKALLGEEEMIRLKRVKNIHNPEEIIRIFEGLEMVINYEEDAEFAKNYVANTQTTLEKE